MSHKRMLSPKTRVLCIKDNTQGAYTSLIAYTLAFNPEGNQKLCLCFRDEYIKKFGGALRLPAFLGANNGRNLLREEELGWMQATERSVRHRCASKNSVLYDIVMYK